MKNIIERQKIKTFVKKILLEWSAEIDHCFFKSDVVIYVHLRPGILAKAFAESLQPKVYMFVDFEDQLKLIFVDSENNEEFSMIFNMDKNSAD